MIIASLLHDVVEDTECTIELVKNEFSQSVANLVEGLTKIVEIRDKNLLPSSSQERLAKSALSFRKMLVASIIDVRVLVSEETLVVYVPIAHRLGISTIKNMLEDIAFSIVLPKEYNKIDQYLKQHTQQLQLKLNHFISKVHNLLLNNGFIDGSFSLEKRIKHHYSIYFWL